MNVLNYPNHVFLILILISCSYSTKIINLSTDQCEAADNDKKDTIINMNLGLSEIKKDIPLILIFSGNITSLIKNL